LLTALVRCRRITLFIVSFLLLEHTRLNLGTLEHLVTEFLPPALFLLLFFLLLLLLVLLFVLKGVQEGSDPVSVVFLQLLVLLLLFFIDDWVTFLRLVLNFLGSRFDLRILFRFTRCFLEFPLHLDLFVFFGLFENLIFQFFLLPFDLLPLLLNHLFLFQSSLLHLYQFLLIALDKVHIWLSVVGLRAHLVFI
jgi:hypothetical protein